MARLSAFLMASGLAVLAQGLIAAPAVADGPALTGPTSLNGQIEATQELPGGGFSAVKLKATGDTYFLSANGRFVIKGAIYDLWAGRSLEGFEDIARAAKTINLAGLGPILKDMRPFVFGEGEKEIVIFLDPYCPYCAKLLAALPAYRATYKFMLITVPFLGEKSVTAVRDGFCAEDQAAALQQLFTHQFISLKPVADCELTVLHRRLIAAQVLGIRGVPFLIHADGRFSAGLPPDLGTWLTAEAGGQ